MSRSPTKLDTGQAQLNTTSPTLIVSARESRVKLKLAFGSGILIGPSGFSASTGFLLNSGNSGETELETGDAVYGLATSGTPTVQFLETFD